MANNQNRPWGSRQRAPHARWLYDIQEGECAHCGEIMAHPDDVRTLGLSLDMRAPTLDHFVPYSQGGPDERYNLMLVHRECNERRKDGPCPALALKYHEQIFTAYFANQEDRCATS